MCRKGQLRADGERVKSATRLIEGQMIRVPPIPTKDAAFDYDPHAPRTRPLKQSDIDEIRACVTVSVLCSLLAIFLAVIMTRTFST